MTGENWLTDHGDQKLQGRDALLRGLKRAEPKLSLTPKTGHVLAVRMDGPSRPDGSFAWKATFDVIIDGDAREVRTLFIQVFESPDFTRRWLTGRILCNVVQFANVLSIRHVFSTARGGNSIAYLHAGFLPISAGWRDLSRRLDQHLQSLDGMVDESGSKEAIRTVLREAQATAVRQLLPLDGHPASPGVLYPQTCRSLLSEGAVSWYGSLDRGDVDSMRIFRRFAASVEQAR